MTPLDDDLYSEINPRITSYINMKNGNNKGLRINNIINNMKSYIDAYNKNPNINEFNTGIINQIDEYIIYGFISIVNLPEIIKSIETTIANYQTDQSDIDDL